MWGRAFFYTLTFLLSPKKKARYLGWNGYNNLGDELLYDVNKKYFGDVVKFWEFPYESNLLKCNVFDYFWLGGGTLLLTDYFTRNLLSDRYKNIVVFGAGAIEPHFYVDYSMVYTKELFDYFISVHKEKLKRYGRFIGVRGPLSQTIMKECGIENVRITGDPVILLWDEINVFKKKFIAENKLNRKNRRLGVNLGSTNDFLWGRNDKLFIRRMINVLKLAKKKGWEILFFCVWPLDRIFLEAAAKDLDCDIVDWLDVGLYGYLGYLLSCDVFIGEKLHAIVLSTLCGIPTIALEYRPKVLDFMEFIDLSEYCVRTDQIRDDLVYLLDEVYERRKVIAIYLEERLSVSCKEMKKFVFMCRDTVKDECIGKCIV